MLPQKLKFIHPYLYQLGYLLMAIGLPTSLFLMSLAQFVLAGNWILEGDFKQKLTRLFQNKPAMSILLIFFIYVAGLFYSEDITEGFQVLRIVAPIFILPFIIASAPPIENFKMINIIKIFIITVFIATLYSTYLTFKQGMLQLNDLRNISPFISHIRFSLMICLAVALLFGEIVKQNFNSKIIIHLLLMVWLISFLMLSQSVTGLLILFLLFLFYTIFILLPKLRSTLKWLIAVVVSIFICLLILIVIQDYKNYANAPILNVELLPERTAFGNPYAHHTESLQIENGNYIWLFISETELREDWNKRSTFDFDGEDKKGHHIKYTIIRYLNSLGYSKDADGLSKLSDEDIRLIESGHANYVYTRIGDYRQRLYQIYFEFDNARMSASPEGHSILLRAEFWKTAWMVFKKNPIVGTGTGDMKTAFHEAYLERETPLSEKWRLMAHNQYLSLLTMFGIIGFLLFLLLFSYSWISLNNQFSLGAKAFFIIIALSMLTEDTLTSQAGVSFYTFFAAIATVYCLRSESPTKSINQK